MLPSGCCGMAGSFGMMRDTYDLSLRVAKPLVDLVEALPEGTRVVASGTSCRHQLASLTERKPIHMAELLAAALEEFRRPAQVRHVVRDYTGGPGQ